MILLDGITFRKNREAIPAETVSQGSRHAAVDPVLRALGQPVPALHDEAVSALHPLVQLRPQSGVVDPVEALLVGKLLVGHHQQVRPCRVEPLQQLADRLAAARELGIDRIELRRRNMVPSSAMP